MASRYTASLGTTLLFAMLMAAPATLSAQAADATGAGFDPVAERVDRPVRLYVINNNFLDVNVYALRGATRVRLATVPSQTGELVEIPRSATQAGLQVQLQASPIGSNRSAVTEPLQVNPGDVVEWRIENNVNLSSLAVWST